MTSKLDLATLKPMANAIRALSMDAVQRANSGHPGMPMGMADVATVLWSRHLKFDPADVNWPDRDRFVLSAGHGSMLIYSLLHLAGVKEVTIEDLKNFRQMDSKTAGHPEYGHCPGVETTTGPLGQGISTAVGMALAERLLNARYGDTLVDHRTWVIASDGDLQEGISHEAISLAGHLKLSKLVVFWDDNEISIDGSTGLADSVDHRARFEAAGWTTIAVDGHDMNAVDEAIIKAKVSDKPVLIACRTVIGSGSPNKQGTAATHGAPLGDDEIAATREAIGWSHEPFEIPEEVTTNWRTMCQASAEMRSEWRDRLQVSDEREAFNAQISGKLPDSARDALEAYARQMAEEKPVLASRAASGNTIAAICEAYPGLVGGSADLTGSNLTKAKSQTPVSAEDFSGSYIHYGIREHAMAAAMNGMSLHGGIRPYGGTFLIFSDYCRPAIRLSGLMNQPVVYVFTHDSIGLGEDGPTHQPVEHLSALRAMPNVETFRPCDAVETAEAWACALERTDGPTTLALSRQKLVHARQDDASENLSARGGYVLREPEEGEAQLVLIATGSEVGLALEAYETLAGKGVKARVVSMPCLERFLRQDRKYRESVVPADLPKVAVEAAVRWGWDGLIGPDGGFVGMAGFGASAPAEALYEHFNITAEAVVDEALKRV
ncbi:transketolase [Marinicauda pacifica]|uniref:Transketolase n=1 Tax=Marinicauda pacifica TaxID=1133559 RepID=A0A4V3RYX4_9PROT|nr:transketolase [Marinicauda pacifica]TGY92059.1 transketolase [Marinicauda pacifica]GGE45610.1 transketolase [Marinicauda pacifica]